MPELGSPLGLLGEIVLGDPDTSVPAPPPEPVEPEIPAAVVVKEEPFRPALAYYELWDPARTTRLGVVAPYDALEGSCLFTADAAGADTLRLSVHRESRWLGPDGPVRELGALGRVLDLYDNPVLLRVNSALPDAAFRLETNIDTPYGDGHLIHASSWKGLLFETKEEALPMAIDLPSVLPSVVLSTIDDYSSVIAGRDVDPVLDVVLGRFRVEIGSSVWDALWELADAVAGDLDISLQRDLDGRWTGKLRVDLVSRPTAANFFLSAPFNLLPGAQRELATTQAFSRVTPLLADGADVSVARFQVNATNSTARTVTTMPGDLIGPADGTWTGKYVAFFTTPAPTATKTFSTLVTADRRLGDRWEITLTAWDASILFGRWFWFYADAACTQPVTYVRHPDLEVAIGARTRLEKTTIPNELVENANAFLSEGYVGGTPGGGYVLEGTPTVTRNTTARKDLDGDGDEETIVLIGAASWKADTSTVNHGQKLTQALTQTMELLRRPLFVRLLVSVEKGQIKVQARDPATSTGRAFTAAAFPSLFTTLGATKAFFANIGNIGFTWNGAHGRVRLTTDTAGGTGTASVELWVADAAGNLLGSLPLTTLSIPYTRNGGTYQSAAMGVFWSRPDSGTPNVFNLAAVLTGSHPGVIKTELSEAQFNYPAFVQPEIVSDGGVFDNFDFRFGPLQPFSDTIEVKVLNAISGQSIWYTDLIQVKRAEGLTDERAPLFDSGASEAVRQVARLWDDESSERYSFTFRALDFHYADAAAHPNPVRVDQLARVVLPDLDLDELFKVVELSVNDHSQGEVEVSVARVPTRLSRLQARQTTDLQQQVDALGELFDRVEVRISTFS